MKKLITISCLLLSSIFLTAQVIINEVDLTNNWVELHNPSSNMVNVSSLRLCTVPSYATISNLSIISGSTLMTPGSYVVIEWSLINMTERELGLYGPSGSFGSAANIIDYVQYGGVASPTRGPLAVTAGVWDDASRFVPFPTTTMNTLNNFNQAAQGPSDTNSNHWWDGSRTQNATNDCIDSYTLFNATRIDNIERGNANYETDGAIESIQLVESTAIVDYDSRLSVELMSGFEVVTGGQLLAFIDGCNAGDGSADSLPSELDGLTLTSIFEDNFDAHDDFENPVENYYCSAPNCSVSGWTSLRVVERFHPVDDNDPSLEANFQLSAEQARGGTGKALKLYDESYGNSGQWGSDILLSKKFDQGYNDLYVEFWVKFQPGYRWHLLEAGHGQNSAKIMRISHRQEGSFPSTYGANGSHGPMSLMNIIPQITHGENEITRLYGNRRCAPQTTNYFCSDEGSGRIIGPISNGSNTNSLWAEAFGDDQWHKIAMRMKLNSAPGVTDGSLMIWYDDQLLGVSPTIDWLGIDTTEPRLLNYVTISGNMHNYPEPEANQLEQWYALDDVRVFSIE